MLTRPREKLETLPIQQLVVLFLEEKDIDPALDLQDAILKGLTTQKLPYLLPLLLSKDRDTRISGLSILEESTVDCSSLFEHVAAQIDPNDAVLTRVSLTVLLDGQTYPRTAENQMIHHYESKDIPIRRIVRTWTILLSSARSRALLGNITISLNMRDLLEHLIALKSGQETLRAFSHWLSTTDDLAYGAFERLLKFHKSEFNLERIQ
ncbi:MAG: hypothetical protein AAGD04_16835 [Pseudomonadota bacterium]